MIENECIDYFRNFKFQHVFHTNMFFDDKDATFKLQEISIINKIAEEENYCGEIVGGTSTNKLYDNIGNPVKIINTTWEKYKDGTSSESTEETIIENFYDDRSNLLLKKEHYKDKADEHNNSKIYNYCNHYDNDGRLTKVMETMSVVKRDVIDFQNIKTILFYYSDDDTPYFDIINVYDAADFLHNMHLPFEETVSINKGRLLRKEITCSYGTNEVHVYSYDNAGILLKEEVYINNELSYCYKYSVAESGKLNRSFASPVNGDYKWKLQFYSSSSKEECLILPVNSFINADMVREAVEYIVNKFGKQIRNVDFDTVYVNAEVPREVYQHYQELYGIIIREVW